jgi:hypothetical protein
MNVLRRGNYPAAANLTLLQQLAHQSIGTNDTGRQRGLTLEQNQLIKELKLIQDHIQQLDTEITHIIEQSREGKILTALPPVGPIQAATIIAAIGHIDNFSRASELKSYFGWAPRREQTGTSFDRSSLTKGGSRALRQVMFLIVGNAIQQDTEWAKIYQRLVQRKCNYDEKTRSYKGKLKVIGRIAGQMISLIYALLKQDAELLRKVPHGSEPPEPKLYDLATHQAHRAGQYHTKRSNNRPQTIIQLPKRSSQFLGFHEN